MDVTCEPEKRVFVCAGKSVRQRSACQAAGSLTDFGRHVLYSDMKERKPAHRMPDSVWRRSLSKKLLAWFQRNARDLPWRRRRDLYAIWISEIMLQQTQVATVVPYFERFLQRFPDIKALAAADEQDVLKLWEGLGYYRRARQLHAAARRLASEHGGVFPTAVDAVRSLPGIGRYTAGAILSIGLDQRLPILEANTIRVLSRLTAYRGEVNSIAGRRRLWEIADSILPDKECGAFNQALMELGSEVCKPRSPVCGDCPVVALCGAHGKQLVAQIPPQAKPKNYERVTEIAVIIRRGRDVLLRQCTPGERWAGLWDFPRFAAAANSRGALDRLIAMRVHDLVGLNVSSKGRFITIKHGVTRFRITLNGYEATVNSSRGSRNRITDSGVRWVRIDALSDYALSVTGRKISRLLASGATIRHRRRAVAVRQ
jgi:A/G-specific adenine glycosylase